MDIQQSIKRLIESGLTQEQIAAHVGVGQGAISKLVLGHRKDMLHSNAVRLQELVDQHCGEKKAAAA